MKRLLMSPTGMLRAFLSVSALFATGCRSGVETYTSFPVEQALQAEVWQIPAVNYYPQAMVISNHRLIVHNAKSDLMFQVFDLDSRTFLYEAGEIGRGGNHFGGDPDASTMRATEQGFQLRVNHDWYEVAVEPDDLHVTDKRAMADVKIPVTNAIMLRDHVFCSENSSSDPDKASLVFYNRQTGKMFKSVPYPVHVLKSDAKRAERAMAYARQSVVHPDGTRFASFFAHFKAFQIISDRGKILHTVDLPITPFAARYDKQSKMRFYGYISNPSATSDRIYVLCAATEEEPNYDVAARQVHVFDWDGHPVACYTLDHDVHHIAVDGRTIYAVNMFKSNQIYVYRF